MATVGAAFNGTSSYIESTTGTDLTHTNLTVGILAYFSANTSTRSWLSTASTTTVRLQAFDDEANTALEIPGGSFCETDPTPPGIPAGGWRLVFISKATGTSAPRAHVYDGTTWFHGDLDSTLANASGVIDRITIGCEGQSGGRSKFFSGEIAWVGIWGETTDDSTSLTYTAYATVAAKGNQQFFTGTSLTSGGSMVDASANANSQTGSSGITAGSQPIPAWFTGFGDPAVAGNWPTAVVLAGTGTRSAGGTTTVTPALPTTVKGQAAIAFRSIKPESATGSTESGWTQLFSATGGTGATGADAGLTRIVCDWKELAGGDSNPTFDQASSPNSVNAVVETFTRDGECSWDIISGGTGDDSTHGTGRSVTSGTSVSWQPGDVVVCGLASDTDTSTAFTSPSITISGCTLSATTQLLGAGGVGTGNDTGLMVYYATVVSGQATVAAAVSLSGGPSSCGPAGFVRIRQTWPIVRPIIIRAQGGAASTNAPAEAASTTVTAFNASEKIATTGGLASVTVTGNNAAANVKPTAGAGSVTATANNASLDLKTTGGLGSVSASAGGGAGSVAVGPTAGSVTVSAFDATVSTAVATSANAGAGSVTVTGNNAAASIKPTAGVGSVTVTGNNAALSLSTSAGTGSVSASAGGSAGSVAVGPTAGSVSATAFNATVSTSAAGSASAGAGSVTVTANDPAASVKTTAGLATSVTATAFNATVSTVVATNAPAGNAAVTATAFNASCSVKATAERAAVTVTGNQAGAGIGPNAGSGTVTCTGYTPGRTVYCNAELASVTATAYQPAADNGAGVATYYPVVRAKRPDVIRLARPRIIRTNRPRLT